MAGRGEADLHEILEAIDGAGEMAGLEAALERLCAAYDLGCACYQVLRGKRPQQEIAVCRAAAPCPGVDAARRYAECDPQLLSLLGSALPVEWSEAPRCGARPAFSVPLRGPGATVALFSAAGGANEGSWPALRRAMMRDLHLIALHLHAKVQALTGSEAPPPLSARELECLAWAAAGKTIEDTAAILGVSVRAVRGYLDSARRKLNCLTKTHAAVRAVQLGLVA